MPAGSHRHDLEMLNGHGRYRWNPQVSKLRRYIVESLRIDMAGEKWLMATADGMSLRRRLGKIGQIRYRPAAHRPARLCNGYPGDQKTVEGKPKVKKHYSLTSTRFGVLLGLEVRHAVLRCFGSHCEKYRCVTSHFAKW
jgi:hypothetical protein